jgi:hypothetical protein
VLLGRAGTSAPQDDDSEGEGEGEGEGEEEAGPLQMLRGAVAAIEEMFVVKDTLSHAHRRVYITPVAVLSQAECRATVCAAEAHATAHGWSTTRHTDYPTHDLPVGWLGEAGASVTRAIETRLLPQMASLFHLSQKSSSLVIRDLFVAKYTTDPGGQVALEAHEDSSEFSFVLALNDLSEHEGGGTYFLFAPVPDPIFRPAEGFATLFSGKNRHCGLPITSGVRYILAGFLNTRACS